MGFGIFRIRGGELDPWSCGIGSNPTTVTLTCATLNSRLTWAHWKPFISDSTAYSFPSPPSHLRFTKISYSFPWSITLPFPFLISPFALSSFIFVSGSLILVRLLPILSINSSLFFWLRHYHEETWKIAHFLCTIRIWSKLYESLEISVDIPIYH